MTNKIPLVLSKHHYSVIADGSTLSIKEQDKDRLWVILLVLAFALATISLPIYAIFQGDSLFLLLLCLWLSYNYSPLYTHGIILRKELDVDKEKGTFKVAYFFKRFKLLSTSGNLEDAYLKVKHRSMHFSSSFGGSITTHQTYFITYKHIGLPIISLELTKNQLDGHKGVVSNFLGQYLQQRSPQNHD